MNHKGPYDRNSAAEGAITPDYASHEVAEKIAGTNTAYIANANDKMEPQYFIARLLGEMFTNWEIMELARKQKRPGITQELIASVKSHKIWAEAIKKFRVNWLINIYDDIPLSNAKVRLRELSDLYYKLTGKYPKVLHTLNEGGVITRAVDTDDLPNPEDFDPETSVIEVEYGDKGKRIKVKKDQYFDQITKILDQVRVELERMDTTLMDDAEFIKIVRECGFENYEV